MSAYRYVVTMEFDTTSDGFEALMESVAELVMALDNPAIVSERGVAL